MSLSGGRRAAESARRAQARKARKQPSYAGAPSAISLQPDSVGIPTQVARPRRVASSRKGVLAQPAAAAKASRPNEKAAFFALGLARALRALCSPSPVRLSFLGSAA